VSSLDGRTATGHCESRIEDLADGRVRLRETWAWDSQTGSGTSVLEEILQPHTDREHSVRTAGAFALHSPHSK
jgi:hypothetical protein